MWTRIFAAGGWYTGDTLACTKATHRGVEIQFGGGPHPEDWYGTLDAVCDGRLDPLPSIGKIIGLDEVPEALDLTRRSAGPPRIVVHPHAGAASSPGPRRYLVVSSCGDGGSWPGVG